MKVILLKDIPKVGNRYDVKDFKEGYAQNVLLSKGLAELATPQALKKLESRKNAIAKEKEAEAKVFSELISEVNNKVITLEVFANEKGHLFKQVSSRDISEAIYKISGISIEEDMIEVGHIKEIGTYDIKIKKGDKEGNCQILVKPIQ